MLHLVNAPNEKQVFLLVMHSFFTLLKICLLELNSYPTNVFCEVTMTLAFGHQLIITPSWSPGRYLCLIWRKFSWKILGMFTKIGQTDEPKSQYLWLWLSLTLRHKNILIMFCFSSVFMSFVEFSSVSVQFFTCTQWEQQAWEKQKCCNENVSLNQAELSMTTAPPPLPPPSINEINTIWIYQLIIV